MLIKALRAIYRTTVVVDCAKFHPSLTTDHRLPKRWGINVLDVISANCNNNNCAIMNKHRGSILQPNETRYQQTTTSG